MPKSKYYEIKNAAKGTAQLYLYGFIGNSVWDEINPKALIDELAELGNLDVIEVHINSGGGSVYGGNAIYNALKMNSAKIEVFIEGLAASMASVIAMAGDVVNMADNSLMMIHDPWTWTEGNAEELRKAADQLDKAKHSLISCYSKKTGLDDEKIANMMSEETWFTASEAIELGFADSTIESIDLAASVKGFRLDGFRNIPTSLSNLLNQSDSTGVTKEGAEMPKQKAQAPVEPTGNEEQLKAEMEAKSKEAAEAALNAEASRRKEVEAIFKPFGSEHSELERECLNDFNVDAPTAREKLLAAISRQPASPAGVNIDVLDNERDKIRAGFSAAILGKVGLSKDDSTNEFRGYSLYEMARYCLEKSGVSTSRLDRRELVGAAFTHTTSDFPNVLKDVMHKTMLKGWDEAPETFQLWTSKGILTDFRAASRVGLNSFPDLQEIRDGAEYKYGTVGDRGETIQLATYGKMISLTRQTIINDDLSAFTRIPSAAGRAARRTIGDLVYAILTGNPAMADGDALFHANHNNIGTGGVPTTASLDELRKLMALQSDGNATSLGISPYAVIVPEALRGKVIGIIESETEMASSQNNSKRPNYVRNLATVISDARLDADSALKYYMVANPAMFDTVEVAYLDGVEEPYLEQQDGWSVDGVSMKVRIDAGVKALDHRTMAYNAGA